MFGPGCALRARELTGDVLRYGSGVEVIEPETLRAAVGVRSNRH